MWDFVEVYTDEGISATSTKNRDGFNRMVEDALTGKIDLILTKSVSRFARNTVDTLTTVRRLKEKGVEVYFEKENIYTMDSKGELLITIMSSLAQEESRSISENVTWGQRKRFADGKVSLPYGNFLGYEKGEDGLPKIIEEEAKTVRTIYRLFLEGKTASGIAKHLTDVGIPTPAGKGKWHSSTIDSILRNEKYKGDAMLQKTYTVDFLTKKMKVNEGEVLRYYVENSHPAIISPEIYDLTQHELKKRRNIIGHKTGGCCFSGRIVCGECGSFYGSKVWHSTDKYRRTIWQCNHKYKNDQKCRTPHINENDLKKAFLGAFNSLVNNKEEIIRNYKEIILKITDTSGFDKEETRLKRECEMISELIRKSVEENASKAMDQEEYKKKNKGLMERYERAKAGLSKMNDKKLESKVKRENIEVFVRMLEERDALLVEFDEDVWNATVEKVVVNTAQNVVFIFKDGMEVDWQM